MTTIHMRKTLAGLCEQLRQRFKLTRVPSVMVDGMELSNLRPVKANRGGSVLNKAGRLVMYGESIGRRLKIYEAAKPTHARFIQLISSHEKLSMHFPAVRAISGRFLVVDWVENTAKSSPPLDALASLTQTLHHTPTAELPAPEFDYWHDYIKPRFVRAAEFLSRVGLAKRVVAEVTKAWEESPRHVMHPDVTPRNLVRAASGRWQIVDNELLGIGGIPLLDLCNTAYALGPGLGQAYVASYLSTSNIRLLKEEVSALNAAWLSRRVGAEFIAGNIPTAQRMIDRYEVGDTILPGGFVLS
jgi:hypothetical protein